VALINQEQLKQYYIIRCKKAGPLLTLPLVCNLIYSAESAPYIKLLNIYGADSPLFLHKKRSDPFLVPISHGSGTHPQVKL